MNGARSKRPQRRRRFESEYEKDNDDRWLLTYSDMITLLMALFIVMWSISSVNISKFNELKASLQSAFSGRVLPANTSVLTGQSAPFAQNGSPIKPLNQPNSQPAFKMDSIKAQIEAQIKQAAAQQDLNNLKRIEQRIDTFAAQHGLSGLLRTSIDQRGLVVELLTDKVLFDTGQAVLKPAGLPLLREIARLLRSRKVPNPIRVEGNTDNVPIHTPQFRSNWELSTARADAVLEFLLGHGVAPSRLSVAGYADQRPIASNATAAGRALNRRVNLVVLRQASATSKGSTAK